MIIKIFWNFPELWANTPYFYDLKEKKKIPMIFKMK